MPRDIGTAGNRDILLQILDAMREAAEAASEIRDLLVRQQQ